MLGHKLCRVLPERLDVWATYRGRRPQHVEQSTIPTERCIEGFAAQDIDGFKDILDRVKPDAVVNAVGIVKQRDEAKQAAPAIQVNALFPHLLADACVERGVRVLQLSTDCVFSGARGNYTEVDVPDPLDLYGRTKLLGELNRPDCLTLRTSIIGWELHRFASLLSWFAAQRGKSIKGYHLAMYTGFSTKVVAELIGDILVTRKDLHGIYH